MKIFTRDKKNSSSLSSHLTLSECVNGKKFIMQKTLYAGSSMRHLSQGCVNACLISVTANQEGSNSKGYYDQSLDLHVQLLLQKNTDTNLYVAGDYKSKR